MAVSLRQQIVAGVITQLKTIRVSNGFNSDLGLNVYDWKTSDWEPQEMPGLSVEDGSENTTAWTLGRPGGGNPGKAQHTLNVEIYIKVLPGTTPPATLRGMIADVIQVLGNNFTFGITNVRALQDQDAALLVQDKNVIAGARLGFHVEYISQYLNPYQ